MISNKKTLHIITNYEHMLRITINRFNAVYKTDFEFGEYVVDEVSVATVHYTEATETDAFHLGVNFGRLCEAFDKNVAKTLPPDYFDNKELFPRFE